MHNGNLLALPVGDGEILYLEPIYSQRKDQASAFPKLLRVLVSYKGRVGYAPTIGDALEQVGIDAKAAQNIEEVDGDSGEKTDTKDDKNKKDAKEDKQPAPASAPSSSDQAGAIDDINKALKGLEDARDGSFEEYGRALDELDKAVESYQKTEK